jgi:hypothetical protein
MLSRVENFFHPNPPPSRDQRQRLAHHEGFVAIDEKTCLRLNDNGYQ